MKEYKMNYVGDEKIAGANFKKIQIYNMENLIIKKLHKKISDRSWDGNVLYIHSSDPVVISEWENCKIYSCNASSKEVCVNFSLPNRRQLILSTDIKESSIDRKSYDNYGGIMYILEPLTEEIAETILKLNII